MRINRIPRYKIDVHGGTSSLKEIRIKAKKEYTEKQKRKNRILLNPAEIKKKVDKMFVKDFPEEKKRILINYFVNGKNNPWSRITINIETHIATANALWINMHNENPAGHRLLAEKLAKNAGNKYKVSQYFVGNIDKILGFSAKEKTVMPLQRKISKKELNKAKTSISKLITKKENYHDIMLILSEAGYEVSIGEIKKIIGTEAQKNGAKLIQTKTSWKIVYPETTAKAVNQQHVTATKKMPEKMIELLTRIHSESGNGKMLGVYITAGHELYSNKTRLDSAVLESISTKLNRLNAKISPAFLRELAVKMKLIK